MMTRLGFEPRRIAPYEIFKINEEENSFWVKLSAWVVRLNHSATLPVGDESFQNTNDQVIASPVSKWVFQNSCDVVNSTNK